ncbi:hypothetical protein CBM2585_A130098 [Cupriavidus taiwanensis]|nr:hypothetical protein CBM2585_A130098 [Cupriavidus taiwanensis]
MMILKRSHKRDNGPKDACIVQ